MRRSRSIGYGRRPRPSSSNSSSNNSSTTASRCLPVPILLVPLLLLLLLPPTSTDAFYLPNPPAPIPTHRVGGGGFIHPSTYGRQQRRQWRPSPAAALATEEAPPKQHVVAVAPTVREGGGGALTAALDDLAATGRHQEAFALLKGVRGGKHPAFVQEEAGPAQLHKVVLACKQARQWALALEALREMRRDPGMLPILLHTYGAAMDACASAGQLDLALEVAAWMEADGHPLNRVAYTTLIKACANAKEGARALEVLARMRRQGGVTLDYLGCLKVVEVLGASGLLAEAMQELRRLQTEEEHDGEETRVVDHRIFFSLVRNALAHNEGQIAAQALALMAEMECMPPPPAMKLLWDAVIKAGHTQQGLALLLPALALTMPPHAWHTTRLRLLLAAEDKRGAMSELAAMAEKGVLLMDRRIISAAVRLFTSASSSSASGDAGAREQGHDPSSFSSSSHDAAAAEEARGGRADTSSSSLSSAAAAATEEGDDILSLVAALRRVGAQLDVVHYTVAISALAKEKKTTTMEGKGGRRAVTDVKTTAVMEKTVDGKAGGAATPGVAAYDGGGGEGGGGGVTTTTAAAADALVHATGEKGRVAGGAVQRAETLLGWMAADGVRPNDMTFTSLIHLLGQAGDLAGASALLSTRMAQAHVQPSGVTVCALLNAHWRHGQVEKGLSLFESLKERGLPCDARVYASVMQALLARGRVAQVAAYLERMAKEGIKPDGRILAIQARVRFAQQDWRGALRLLKEADAAGVMLDNRFFTVLLDGLAQGGHLSKCWATLREMRSRGVAPNAFAYAALLKAFSAAQAQQSQSGRGGGGGAEKTANPEKLQEYVRTFERAIQEEGLRPTVVNYNALMEACGKVGDANAARGFFERMQNTPGLHPDVVSWSVLIKAHALSGQYDDAVALLRRMVEQARVSPTLRTVNPLVDRCARAGRTDLVDAVLRLMSQLPPSLGGPLAPDVVTYNSLLTAVTARGETQKAEAMLADMMGGMSGSSSATASAPAPAPAPPPRPNVVTFNILMDHYSGKGMWDECCRTLQERMPLANVTPDAQTYNHFLDGLARAGRLDECEALLKEMREQAKLRPDGFTAAVMLGVYRKSGDLGKLDAFLQQLREEGVEPPPHVMVGLVRTYLQHKQPERAMALLEAQRLSHHRNGPPPKKAYYSFIVQHLFEQGRIGEGFRYLETLATAANTRLDGRCYAILGKTLLEKGQAEAAAALLLGDMRRRRVPLCKEIGPVLVSMARAAPAREKEARALLNDAVKAAVLPSHAVEALWASSLSTVPPIEGGLRFGGGVAGGGGGGKR